MKAYTQKIIHVSVLESDPVRFLGLRAIFPSQAGIQIRKGSVISVLEGPEDELVLMTVNRGPAFYAGMSALKAARPEIKIIVTGPGDNDEDILRAVTAGAKGYISEEATADQFKKAIHEVHAGSVWIPRRVLAMFIERVTTSARRLEPSNASKISEREREVLRLLVAG